MFFTGWNLSGDCCLVHSVLIYLNQSNKQTYPFFCKDVCVCVFPSWPSKQLTTFQLENSCIAMHSISYANEVVGLFHEHYHTFYVHFAFYLNISIFDVFLALMSFLGEFPVTNYDNFSCLLYFLYSPLPRVLFNADNVRTCTPFITRCYLKIGPLENKREYFFFKNKHVATLLKIAAFEKVINIFQLSFCFILLFSWFFEIFSLFSKQIRMWLAKDYIFVSHRIWK